MSEEVLRLEDYRLTTAEILYHMPDEPDSLQTYVWQSLDRVPDFPRLNDVLDVWQQQSDDRLHSVRVAYVGAVDPFEWDQAKCLLTSH